MGRGVHPETAQGVHPKRELGVHPERVLPIHWLRDRYCLHLQGQAEQVALQQMRDRVVVITLL